MKISKSTVIDFVVPATLLGASFGCILIPQLLNHTQQQEHPKSSTESSVRLSHTFFNAQESFKNAVEESKKRREAELPSRSGHRPPHHPTVEQVLEVFKPFAMNEEGCKQDAYECFGTWTIGIGYAHNVTPGMHWSMEKVLEMFDLEARENIQAVLDQTPNRDLTPLQTAMIADFRFMLGSSIDAKVIMPFNEGASYEWLADKFLQYDRGTSVWKRHQKQSTAILSEQKVAEEQRRVLMEIERRQEALHYLFTQTNLADVLTKNTPPTDPFALPSVMEIKQTTNAL